MISILERLQLDIAALLNSLDEFQYIPVLILRPRSSEEALLIQTKLDQSLAGLTQKNGKAGVCVIIQMPTADATNPDIPGPRFEVTIEIKVFENPLINMGAGGTQLSAEEVSLAVHNSLQQFNLGITGAQMFPAPKAIEPDLSFLDKGRIVYNANIKTRFQLVPPSKCMAPAIGGNSASMTLSSATPGATIYFTTDESFPSAQNSAQEYTDPVAVTPGARVRAAAYLDGKHGSDVTAQIIN